MRRRISILAALLIAFAWVTVARAQTADYYGPQAIDSTNRVGSWLSPAQHGLSYSHDLATGRISLRLAPWGVIKSARGPAIAWALEYSYGLELDQEVVNNQQEYAWYPSGPMQGGSLGGSDLTDAGWTETTPAVRFSSGDYENDQLQEYCA
ncbi:MAG TPA: hypothetical protein VN515_10565, partial [Terriglobales bacterium]|nr:hypothetical protein [Terriglobales bacterium]